MPRPHRNEVAGGFYHVTQRGNGGAAIFEDDNDREFFLSFLGRVVLSEAWQCFSYCLMTNHFHLVIRIPTETLAQGMRWLAGIYAQFFNGVHGRSGHLFGGRYRTSVIESEQHLVQACEYVEMNPVRAGLCTDPAEWKWSSYRARIGLVPMPPFLLSLDDLS